MAGVLKKEKRNYFICLFSSDWNAIDKRYIQNVYITLNEWNKTL
jgi:hypothetical protein